MKKFCIICLALCLAATVLAAAPVREAGAEERPAVQIIDLSGYSDGDLVAILSQVQAEIAARNIEKTASLPIGTYVFGQDVPVGKYHLRKSEGDYSGIISLAAADDPEDEYPSKLYEYASSDESFETYFNAADGDRLTIVFPCELTVSAGIAFQ